MKINHLKYFLLFCILSLILYYPTRYSGLTYDFIGWQEAYEKGDWTDIINCFGYNGLHQVLHFVFYSLYSILKTNAVGWYIVFALANAGVVYLLYCWIKKLIRVLDLDLFKAAPLVGALIFLFHPHSLEVVTWKVCIHYIMSSMWLLLILINYLNYLDKGEKRFLIYSYIFFTLSLFTLEISYIYPVLMLLFVMVSAGIKNDIKVFWAGLKILIAPMFALLLGLLILNKIVLGDVVGHYGVETHLNMDLLSVASNELKYLIKHLTLFRFSTHHAKVFLFETMSTKIVSFQILLALLSIVLYWAVKFTRLTKRQHLFFLGLFGFFLLLLPTANMYFYYILLGHNDRFGYVPNLFLVLMLIAIFSWLPKYIRWGAIIFWLGTTLFFHQKLAQLWKNSNIAFTTLLDDFTWYDREKVIILNLPDNYHGVFVFSVINERSNFEEALEYNLKKDFKGIMYDVLLYNMMDLNDGVMVHQIGPRKIRVKFRQWGSWWHKEGIGATPYETKYYKVTEVDFHYDLELKDNALDATFLYQDSMKLKEFHYDPNWKKEN